MIRVNGFDICPTHFPDGSQQVWKLQDALFSNCSEAHIEWKFDGDIELMTIMQLSDLFRRSGIAVHLSVPYLPYGRQDKAVSNNSCFGLHTFLNMIKHCVQFDSIEVFDPHSLEWLETVLDDVRIYLPDIDKLAQGYDYVCYPDAGASRRYYCERPIIIGEKVRDQATGHITHYSLDCGDIANKKVLVVDDICDGGATFLILGKALALKQASSSLYISHGIFSRGQRGINDFVLPITNRLYNEVITTDSLSHNDLKIESFNRFDRVQIYPWRFVSYEV